jgi:hypothetical protein
MEYGPSATRQIDTHPPTGNLESASYRDHTHFWREFQDSTIFFAALGCLLLELSTMMNRSPLSLQWPFLFAY